MKISPVNIYSYRQSFTSTQKPNNTKTTNSLTDIEKQQKAQEALAEINELKQEAQKNYQDAKYYLNKSKIFYQEWFEWKWVEHLVLWNLEEGGDAG